MSGKNRQMLEIPDIFISGLLFKENGEWTSLCLQFDIASQGKTPWEAVENNFEAVELYVGTYLAEGKKLEEIYRPAPFRYHLLYTWYSFKYNIRRLRKYSNHPPYYFAPLRSHAI